MGQWETVFALRLICGFTKTAKAVVAITFKMVEPFKILCQIYLQSEARRCCDILLASNIVIFRRLATQLPATPLLRR